MELGKQTAITVEVESRVEHSRAAKGFITRSRRRSRKKEDGHSVIRWPRSVIDCNFDRRTRARRSRQFCWRQKTAAEGGEESEPLSRRWRRRRRRRTQLMNDRRVSAVFGPLLIGSALQRQRKTPASSPVRPHCPEQGRRAQC